MKVSSFIDLKKKYKSGIFKWHVAELYLFNERLIGTPDVQGYKSGYNAVLK